MIKKNKQLIIGILIGILITLTIPVSATVSEYFLKQSDCKIVVDGIEVKGELPLLMMEPGFNYIPAAEIRSICDKIGIDFEFDAPTKEIRINTQSNIIPELVPDYNIKEGDNSMNEIKSDEIELLPDLVRGRNVYVNAHLAPTRVENDLIIYNILGTEYISIVQAKELHDGNFYPFWWFDEETQCEYIDIIDRKTDVLISNIEFVRGAGLRRYDVLVEYKYYLNTILPLIPE